MNAEEEKRTFTISLAPPGAAQTNVDKDNTPLDPSKKMSIEFGASQNTLPPCANNPVSKTVSFTLMTLPYVTPASSGSGGFLRSISRRLAAFFDGMGHSLNVAPSVEPLTLLPRMEDPWERIGNDWLAISHDIDAAFARICVAGNTSESDKAVI